MDQKQDVPSSRRGGVINRALLAIAGIDAQRMSACPGGDRLFALRTGMQLVVAMIFVAMTSFLALQVGFDRHPRVAAVIALAASLVALVIFLLDSNIVQADWYEHGRELIAARGLGDEGRAFRWRRPATVAVRLTLSTAIALAFASFIELRLFEDDIAKQMDRRHKTENAVLFDDLKREIDGREAEIIAALREADTRLLALRAQADRQRAVPADTADLDAEIAALSAQSQQLISRRTQLIGELAERRADAINEEAGTRMTERHSGLAGRGPRFRVAQQMVELRQGELAQLSAEIDALASKLVALRSESERRRGELVSSRQVEGARLEAAIAAIEPRRQDLEQRLIAVRLERDAIPATAKSRGGYVDKPEGFLAQVSALAEIKQEPAVWWMALGMKLVILLIEIIPVAGKVWFGMPSLYAVRTALDFEAAVDREIASYRRLKLAEEKELLALQKEVEDERVVAFERRGDALRKKDIQDRFYSRQTPGTAD